MLWSPDFKYHRVSKFVNRDVGNMRPVGAPEPAFGALGKRRNLVSSLLNLPVLVVDDNRHACQLLKTILKAITQAETRDCASPEEAFGVLQEWRPGMLITDFHMSPMDGIKFTRELRANPVHQFRFKPVLLMTAETPSQALVEQVKDAGVDSMVTKPIVPETLVGRMEWALKAAHERAEKHVAENPREEPKVKSYKSDSGKSTWLID